MWDDSRTAAAITRGRDSRPEPARRYQDAAIERLLRLRERVLERLDAIQVLANQACEPSSRPPELERLEQTLRQGMSELEEARRQCRDEIERRQAEWNARLIELEADRHSLAEAWERVERERIEAPAAVSGGATPHLHAPIANAGTRRAWNAMGAATPGSAASEHHPSNPVAQAILREFQTLSRDVRSNTAARSERS